MKKKAIEKLEPKTTRKDELVGTIQNIGDTYIINIFWRKSLQYKYCIDLKTLEYKTLDILSGIWSQKKIYSLTASNYIQGYYWNPKSEIRWDNIKEEDSLREKCNELMQSIYRRSSTLEGALDELELESNRLKRIKTEENNKKRIEEMTERSKEMDEDKIREWAIQKINPQHYLLKTKDGCSCSACGSRIETKAKRGQTEECPQCKAILKVKTAMSVSVTGMICIMQRTEQESVIKHIDCEVLDSFGEKKKININEAVRVIVKLEKRRGQFGESTKLLYGQINRKDYYSGHITDRHLDDVSLWKSNPCNRRTTTEYLYPENIEETLNPTTYSDRTRLFKWMADNGIKANYNRLMCATENTLDSIEYLAKGRFYRLTEELSDKIDYWNGALNHSDSGIYSGDDIFETLNLSDKQLINRLRDRNGGNNMLKILQWVDSNNLKLPDEALDFFEKEKINKWALEELTKKVNISPIAIVNYLKKQKPIYQRTYNVILEQWLDYLNMMDRLKRKYTDELFYKPKNLKQRHDEVTEEINARARELEMKDHKEYARQQAKEFRKKFPQAERILKDIKPKFEYQGEKMSIIVPSNLSEIVLDGKTLHHCAGATNRYFDRIENKETYICFLRKNEQIDVPYYTIEVEPGGTIRQHRGYLDEEPEIETVKPFLKEWQKEIKKRMSKADKELAKISKIKREANIEDLKARKNTFVLKGLMEDFMEA